MVSSSESRTWRRVQTGLDESGVALAAAVFALAIMAALVASIFFAARLEQQSGQNMFFAAQAREAAEAGLAESIAALDAAALQGLIPGGVPLDLGPLPAGNGLSVQAQVARLTDQLYLIRSFGTRHDAAGAALASRNFGMLVQLAGAEGATPVRLVERGWVRLY